MINLFDKLKQCKANETTLKQLLSEVNPIKKGQLFMLNGRLCKVTESIVATSDYLYTFETMDGNSYHLYLSEVEKQNKKLCQ